jgi:hypothetical protein
VYTDGATLAFVDLLRAEAGAGAWRIIEAYAEKGPFELDASWSGGEGRGQEVKITVPRATRFAVFASSLTLKAANLASVENRVGCNVSEGYCVSANQFEVRGTGTEGEIPVAIPPFATHARLEVADPAQLANSLLSVLDGVGVLRSKIAASNQPFEGLPLAGAGSLKLLVPATLRFRTVFSLSI